MSVTEITQRRELVSEFAHAGEIAMSEWPRRGKPRPYKGKKLSASLKRCPDTKSEFHTLVTIRKL